jgi:hypothetical protein
MEHLFPSPGAFVHVARPPGIAAAQVAASTHLTCPARAWHLGSGLLRRQGCRPRSGEDGPRPPGGAGRLAPTIARYAVLAALLPSAAWAAARRAMGTRNGEQET